jgi:hypothetical protein
MRLPALITCAFIALTSETWAQQFVGPLSPPPEYDYPHKGVVEIHRGFDTRSMRRLCPGLEHLKIILGCANNLGDKCLVAINSDDFLKLMGVTFDQVYRHEQAHCNGWPPDHSNPRKPPAKPGTPA